MIYNLLQIILVGDDGIDTFNRTIFHQFNSIRFRFFSDQKLKIYMRFTFSFLIKTKQIKSNRYSIFNQYGRGYTILS